MDRFRKYLERSKVVSYNYLDLFMNPESISSDTSKLDLVKPRKWWFLLSGLLMILSVIFLIRPGLVPGIEFSSGTTMLVQFSTDTKVDQAQVREVLTRLDHPEARIQSTGVNQYLIKTDQFEIPDGAFTEVVPESDYSQKDIAEPALMQVVGKLTTGKESSDSGEIFVRSTIAGDACSLYAVRAEVPANRELDVYELVDCPDGRNYLVGADGATGWVTESDIREYVPNSAPVEPTPSSDVELGEKAKVESELEAALGPFELLEFSSVSPVVSDAAVRNAALAVVIAALFIMGYVRFAFSTLEKPWRYAICAIIALFHDTLIVLGFFAVLGPMLGLEVNLMFITGVLTAIGFSVHDSIVVFDRIRENITFSPRNSLVENVNLALTQTLARSMNTSLTLLLPIGALLLLGGDTIRSFLMSIFIGVIVGTYSSIGLAAQLLVSWEVGDFARWLRIGRNDRDMA